MSRHERDVVSLMAGLLLVLAGGLFLLSDLTDFSVDGRWATPGVLITVGVLGLLATLRSGSARRDADDLPADELAADDRTG